MKLTSVVVLDGTGANFIGVVPFILKFPRAHFIEALVSDLLSGLVLGEVSIVDLLHFGKFDLFLSHCLSSYGFRNNTLIG